MSRLKKLKIEAVNEANKRVLNEQTPDIDGIKQVQRFLNAMKITGNNGQKLDVDGATCNDRTCQTGQAIEKYQTIIGVNPTDGVWGEKTMSSMRARDKKYWEGADDSWF